jgi:hypothetical protein
MMPSRSIVTSAVAFFMLVRATRRAVSPGS